MEQVKAYRTSDGELFASEAEAREHEGYLQQEKRKYAVGALLQRHCPTASEHPYSSSSFDADIRRGAQNAIIDLASTVDEWLPELVKLVEEKP